MTKGEKQLTALSRLKKKAEHVFDLEIASHTVPVYNSPDLVKSAGCWGVAILHPDYCIILDTACPKHQWRRTLLHEFLEVVNDIYHLNLNEQKIRVLEQSIWQLNRQKRI